MSELGIGTMMYLLGDGTQNSASKYYGRKIIAAKFENDKFSITFKDGVSIDITDNGQSCCENRYMVCDDVPEDLVGGKLRAITLKYSEGESEYDGCHEICFIEIATNKTSITLATHNEHNGYYGGFGLNITEHNGEQEAA